MKLSSIHLIKESAEDVLGDIYTFEMQTWIDDEVPPEQQLDYLTKGFTQDPPPGISPVEAQVVKIGQTDEDGLTTIAVRMSVEDFIRNSIEYDIEPYEVLNRIKQSAGGEVAKVAYEFMKNPDSNLRIAMLGKDAQDGTFSADNWPTQPDL